jgi:CheY-like chemotaxis protein
MKTILVVDDEDDIRKAIVLVLKEKGFETIEANNGAEAFEITRAQKPDMIISDIVMDRVNGFLFHELLQEDERAASIPLILMTGHALQASEWKSHPEVAYLEKPFSMAVLLDTIKRVLPYDHFSASSPQ